MSKLLFEMMQGNKDNHHLEVMKKQVYWCDDYIEIMCIGILTSKKYLFRLSTSLVSVMIQKYYFNLRELWRLLANSAQIYVDRILFSIQHIQNCPMLKDSHRRDAYLIYKTTRLEELENGNTTPWNIEMLTNITEPFDLEILVQLVQGWDRKHVYRIESHLLKSYFEKYCLELYEDPLVPESAANAPIDVSQFPKEPNHMLQALVDELVFDKENDEVYVKSIEMLRLEDYLHKSVRKHHVDIVSAQQQSFHSDRMMYQKEQDEKKRAEEEEEEQKEIRKSFQSSSMDSPGKEDELFPTGKLNLQTEPQPPPIEKYAQFSESKDQQQELSKLSLTSPSREPSLRINTTGTPDKINLLNTRAVSTNRSIRSISMDLAEEERKEKERISELQAFLNPKDKNQKKFTEFEEFLNSFSSPDRIKNIQEKINEIHEENYQAIINTIDETNRLLKNPLKEFQQELETQKKQQNEKDIQEKLASTTMNNGDGGEEKKTESEMKAFIVREALAIKPEVRSLMSTKIIMNYLKNESDLGKYLSHCSMDDLQCIANESTLLELPDTQVINTLQINQNESISCMYILICGGELMAKSITKEKKDDEEDDEEDEDEEDDDNDEEEEEDDNNDDDNPPTGPKKVSFLSKMAQKKDRKKNKKSIKHEETEEEREKRLQQRLNQFEAEYLEKNCKKTQKAKLVQQQTHRKISLYANKTQNADEKTELSKFNSGNILGENILNGSYLWQYSLLSPVPTVNKEGKLKALGKSRRTLLYTPKTQEEQEEEQQQNRLLQQQLFEAASKTFYFVKISIATILRYIGRKDQELEEYLLTFWKSIKLYLDIIDYNENIVNQSLQLVKNEKLNYEKFQLETIKNQFYHNLTPINVIESARIRTYQAGMDICTQGKLRHHMFIMKQGSATYFRLFPKDIVGLDIIPEKVETIIDRNTTGTLLSGDYSFLDSEDVTIIDKIEELDLQFLDMISYSLHYQNQNFEEDYENNEDGGEEDDDLYGEEEDHFSDDPIGEDGGGEGERNMKKSARKGGIFSSKSQSHDFQDYLDELEENLYEERKDFLGDSRNPMKRKKRNSIFVNENEGKPSTSSPKPSTPMKKNKNSPIKSFLTPSSNQKKQKQSNRKNRHKSQELTKKQLIQQFYSNEKLFEYHQRKYHRFAHYKNSLVANTRCEVCVIEIGEIAKSIPLLKKLIELTNYSYPQLLISNEEIIYNYYKQQFWLQDRLFYLQEIEKEYTEKKLAEFYAHDLHNNENDLLYYNKQPNQHFKFLRFANSYQDKYYNYYLSKAGIIPTLNDMEMNHPESIMVKMSRPNTANPMTAVGGGGEGREGEINNNNQHQQHQHQQRAQFRPKTAKERKEIQQQADEEYEKQRKEELIAKEMIPFQYTKKFDQIVHRLKEQENLHQEQLIQFQHQLNMEALKEEYKRNRAANNNHNGHRPESAQESRDNTNNNNSHSNNTPNKIMSSLSKTSSSDHHHHHGHGRSPGTAKNLVLVEEFSEESSSLGGFDWADNQNQLQSNNKRPASSSSPSHPPGTRPLSGNNSSSPRPPFSRASTGGVSAVSSSNGPETARPSPSRPSSAAPSRQSSWKNRHLISSPSPSKGMPSPAPGQASADNNNLNHQESPRRPPPPSAGKNKKSTDKPPIHPATPQRAHFSASSRPSPAGKLSLQIAAPNEFSPGSSEVNSPTTRPTSRQQKSDENRPESPTTSAVPPPGTTERRRNAVNIQLRNVHDIRITSEQARTQTTTPAAFSMEEQQQQQQKLTLMDELLWQCHEQSPRRSSQSARRHSRGASDLLTKRRAPEDFVQLYKERLSNDPKQRFIDEFIHKTHF